MSDWESDGDDVKPAAAPTQSQPQYNQGRDYGNAATTQSRPQYNQGRDFGNDQNRGYGNDRRGYGNEQRSSYQQNDQWRDNRQNYGGGGRDNQQNYGNGRRDDRNGGNRAGGGGGGGSGGGYNRGGYGGNDFKMEVDHSKVGMIIGKGGCKIKEIQEKYNVNVKIGESTENCFSLNSFKFLRFAESKFR